MNVPEAHSSRPVRIRAVGVGLLAGLLLQLGCDRGVLSDRRQPPELDRSTSLDAVATNWPRPPHEEPSVRIRVRSIPLAEAHCVLGSNEQRLLLLDGAKRRPYLLDAPLVIKAAAPGWSIQDSSGDLIQLDQWAPLSIRTLQGAPATIEWDQVRLPGSLELVPRPTRDPQTVDLVARVGIERYLPGVLDGELYGSWPLACFQAQAVAARSYAVAEASFWGPRRHYDMVAGPASQAWSGLGNSERAREAVESTNGVVLLYEDRVVPAFYSACCGGRSASAYQAITDRASHRIAPLAAREDDEYGCCEEASVREWAVAFDLVELAPKLRAWGKAHDEPGLASLGILQSCRIVESNPAGRSLQFELVDIKGHRVRIDADSLRSVLGKVPRSADGRTGRLRSSSLRTVVRGGRLEVTGWGYGHGVGLCQYGAKGMADTGADWERILQRYYPGARPTRAWPAPG